MARLDSGTLEKQAARIRELLEADCEDAILWFGLGQTLLSLGRPGDAIEAFEAATRLDPDYTAAFRDLGRAHLENANPSEAARLFAHAIGLAEKTGDLQTGRVIHVLLKRAELAGGTHDAKRPERHSRT